MKFKVFFFQSEILYIFSMSQLWFLIVLNQFLTQVFVIFELIENHVFIIQK